MSSISLIKISHFVFLNGKTIDKNFKYFFVKETKHTEREIMDALTFK
jgi:hypothetical protein